MTPAVSARCQELGVAWANDVLSGLEAEGRPASGMWPGTLSEARSLLARAASAAGGSYDRRNDEEQVRAVYAAARDCWNRRRAPDVPDPQL
ncbi:MAG: hypothetical protein AAGH15_24690 [Myxococcota bacterium]